MGPKMPQPYVPAEIGWPDDPVEIQVLIQDCIGEFIDGLDGRQHRKVVL